LRRARAARVCALNSPERPAAPAPWLHPTTALPPARRVHSYGLWRQLMHDSRMLGNDLQSFAAGPAGAEPEGPLAAYAVPLPPALADGTLLAEGRAAGATGAGLGVGQVLMEALRLAAERRDERLQRRAAKRGKYQQLAAEHQRLAGQEAAGFAKQAAKAAAGEARRMAAEASAISHLWDASAQQSSAERIARGASFQITSQGSADPLHRAQSLRV
jgi:hypothetical protein